MRESLLVIAGQNDQGEIGEAGGRVEFKPSVVMKAL